MVVPFLWIFDCGAMGSLPQGGVDAYVLVQSASVSQVKQKLDVSRINQ